MHARGVDFLPQPPFQQKNRTSSEVRFLITLQGGPNRARPAAKQPSLTILAAEADGAETGRSATQGAGRRSSRRGGRSRGSASSRGSVDRGAATIVAAIAAAIAGALAAAATGLLLVTTAAAGLLVTAAAVTAKATTAAAVAAAATVAGDSRVVSAQQGDAHHREEDRDAKNHSSIHLGSSNFLGTYSCQSPNTMRAVITHGTHHPRPDGDQPGIMLYFEFTDYGNCPVCLACADYGI